MFILNPTEPYSVLEHKGITYSSCRDFNYISRYRGLRQVIHSPEDLDDRLVALESPNPFVSTNLEVKWHEVTNDEENRLDLIAFKYLGSAQYGWVIAYFNTIEDGFSCYNGQKLMIPTGITDLMKSGEILQNVTALRLNLSSE